MPIYTCTFAESRFSAETKRAPAGERSQATPETTSNSVKKTRRHANQLWRLSLRRLTLGNSLPEDGQPARA
jgi:hypothetical protein